MKTEVNLPAVQLDLEALTKFDSHLKKLRDIPPIPTADANRRIILPSIHSGTIIGYIIQDFYDSRPISTRYFPIERLDNL